jgi:hypothetical protein
MVRSMPSSRPAALIPDSCSSPGRHEKSARKITQYRGKIGAQLQHLGQIAGALSAAAKVVNVEEAKRLHRRLWNGKARHVGIGENKSKARSSSVKAVHTVPSARPTTSRFRSSSTLMFASDLATAPTAGAPALLAYPHLKMAVSVLATPDKGGSG